MPNYYTIETKKNLIDAFFGLTYPYLTPTKSGFLDIFNNGYWKIGPGLEAKDCCQIWLQEYDVKSSGLIRSANDLASRVLPWGNNPTGEDYYTQIYLGQPTGFVYSLPRIIKSGDSVYSPISNAWQEDNTAKEIAGDARGYGNFLTKKEDGGRLARGLGKVLSTAGRLVQFAPDATRYATSIFGKEYGKEPIKSFKETAPHTLSINFQLYNTPRSAASARETNKSNHQILHKEFIEVLYFQNLKTRTGPFAMLPPKLYKLTSYPSHNTVHMPVCFIKSYDIKSIGKMHYLGADGRKGTPDSPNGIPEAYNITIVIESIAAQTANTFVKVLEDP